MLNVKPAALFDAQKLISWLETKPSDESYSYINPTNCVLAQFLHGNGYPNASVGVYSVRPYEGNDPITFPDGWNYVARGWPPERPEDESMPDDLRLTFGEALKRARAKFGS